MNLINVFELVPDNDAPRNDCYDCIGCIHLVSATVNSSHNIYIECDLEEENDNE